ncbi:HAD-IA family hydrolase [Breoghania sp. L-A4]|uniref:HAD family hydrolase n=1 Tax=Breoghania sp. L-A4 TaxID=2304600 RepID=UPI000E35F996|nr:HAD-IA family hydrolase [Breoghania sp. L-A4]AXS40565.1 HAD family hydrolase [Breoghania sp. L-A4]
MIHTGNRFVALGKICEMTKCLMLDVDGVLVDGRPGDGQRWDRDLSEQMAVSSDALVEQFFKAEWSDVVTGKKDLLPTLSTVLKRIAPSVDAEELIVYWFEMDSRIVEAVLSDVRLARQKGIPVYLTTNQEHMRAAYLMQTMGLGDEVDGIVYSAKVGSKKPEPEFFTYAAQATGRQPEEMLLIDDTMSNIIGARSAGWNAAHWDGTERLWTILRRNIE